MHRDGVVRARRAGPAENETAGSQEGCKTRKASTLGSTSIGHGLFNWRIHSNCFDINITGGRVSDGRAGPGT